MAHDKLTYFSQWPDRKYISPTMASCVLQCPWQYWAKYIGKVDKDDGLALRRGAFFDSLVDGVDCTVALSGQDVNTIIKRFDEYRPFKPVGETQHPIQFELGYNEWWVRGYVDILPDDPDKPFVENKLATRPWERKKLKYNRMQIMTYSFALNWRPGVFHIKNMETSQFQTFGEADYLGGKDRVTVWKQVAKQYVKACKLIEAANWEPLPGILCKGSNKHGDEWECDYYDVCPLTRGTMIKERELDELRKVF